MNKIIFVFLALGAFASSDGIFYSNQVCTCDQIVIEQDCALMGQLCSWSGSSCSTVSCSSITDQSTCAYNSKCMWKGGVCTSFTFCSQLSGQTQKSCLEQSNQCPYTNGSTCGGTNQLMSCSKLIQSQYCEGYISNDGVCTWNNSACVAATNCNILNEAECGLAPLGCLYVGTVCQPLTCSMYTTSVSCKYVLTTIYQIYGLQVQMCAWNTQTNTCANAANMDGLTSADCNSQTAGTYRWVTNSSGGSCQACYESIIQVVILAIFMILI